VKMGAERPPRAPSSFASAVLASAKDKAKALVGGSSPEKRYHLQKVKLGQGSFGTVWRAVDKSATDKYGQRREGFEAIVAVKQIKKAALMDRQGMGRKHIQHEVKIMKELRHAGRTVLKLLDVWEDRRSIFLALSYCDGGDFSDKLREFRGKIYERQAAQWMLDICLALRELHKRSICHRDIKPENFMVSLELADGRPDSRLVLADFGLAVKCQGNNSLKDRCGTPAFMAPEVTEKSGQGYGFPVDLYGAGIILYMMLHDGQHPFVTREGRLDQGARRKLMEGRTRVQGAANEDWTSSFMALLFPGNSFSREAQNLCRALLHPDPARRLTAGQCLEGKDGELGEWLQRAQALAPDADGKACSPTNAGTKTLDSSPHPTLLAHRSNSLDSEKSEKSLASKPSKFGRLFFRDGASESPLATDASPGPRRSFRMLRSSSVDSVASLASAGRLSRESSCERGSEWKVDDETDCYFTQLPCHEYSPQGTPSRRQLRV